ncbi:MAG: AAA family ATPase, partial [Candidatus Sericytochromatia bacterium]|nr:AAA family ATPase [Candidatus Sericytochromatia bacterium]
LSIAYNSNDEAFISHIEDIIPKGIIFYGPPGTGKTLFAKGIAEAINATVYIISGPELKSKWVGEGEANIRRLFARARATAPSVIVFDEFDSVAPARTSGAHDGAMESSHSMVNQLLTEMDGFRKEELVFVIGTTNFPQALDPALLRPGRFEYQIEIPFPEWEDRKAILNLYNLKHRTELSKENIETLTSWTERLFENSSRYTGDHLDALIRSLKRYLINKKLVKLDDEEFNTWLKLQTKTHTLTNDEEKVIAIHEAGHTMMYRKYNRLDEVKKVTIESGITDVLGMVEINIKENHNFYTENDLRSNIAIALGGYVAEKIIFTQVSTGSYNDLSSATKIAEDMVVFYGMGNLNVPRNYGDQEGKVNPFFNNLISPQIDAILLEIKEEVINYLNENKSLLQLFADLLIQKRTLNPDEIKEILGKQV